MQVLVFDSQNQKVTFEPSHRLGDFIAAKEGCNSIYLTSGEQSKYSFHESMVRQANKIEADAYLQLKNRSPYLKFIEMDWRKQP